DAELRERLLRRVPRVLWIAKHVVGEPLDPRRVTFAQGLERESVAVLRPRDEDRIAELLVDGSGLRPERLPDRFHSRTSLVARVGPLPGARRPVVTWPTRTAVPLRGRDGIDAAAVRGRRPRRHDRGHRPSDRGARSPRPHLDRRPRP